MEMEAEGSEGAACDNSQAEELPPDLPKMRSDVFSVDTDKIYAMVRPLDEFSEIWGCLSIEE